MTVSKTAGKIIPIIKTNKDKIRAKIIRPIVIGSFKSLMLIREKTEARQSKIVDNSNIPTVFFLNIVFILNMVTMQFVNVFTNHIKF